MIKLTGSVSRKVPIPGHEFSSQSFSAGMELEIGNEASSEEVKKKFQEMYGILESTVKAQIICNGGTAPSAPAHESGNGADPATPKQTKLIEKLVRERNIFGRDRIRLLGVKTKEEAKKSIKELLSKGGGYHEE